MNGKEKRKLTLVTLGQNLGQIRKERGISLEAVEQAIQVYAHHLEALERGDLEMLPQPTWARGFLISYATYLGLDGDSLIREAEHRRLFGLKGYLSLRWRGAIVIMGTVVLVGILTLAAIIVAPYNGVTSRITEFFGRVAPGLFLGNGPQRVVILGFSDRSSTGADNMMVANVAEDGLGLLAIPGNTLAEIPDHGNGRLDEAFAEGGPGLVCKTVTELTDTEVPNYITIDEDGIKEIVDSLGGVRTNVPVEMSGRASSSGPTITLQPGTQTLNGDRALVYLQGKDLSDAAERADRQQIFLNAMFREALGPSNLLSNPTTLNTILEHTDSNMSSIEMAQLAGRVGSLRRSGTPVKRSILPGRQEKGQANYWMPDHRKLPAVFKKTLR